MPTADWASPRLLLIRTRAPAISSRERLCIVRPVANGQVKDNPRPGVLTRSSVIGGAIGRHARGLRQKAPRGAARSRAGGLRALRPLAIPTRKAYGHHAAPPS